MIRAGLLLVVAVASAAALPPRAQDDRIRFEIAAPTDTGFNVMLGSATWVRRGMTGIVVDPRNGDALVARFTVRSVEGSTARALVTGLTTDLRTTHVALLRAPKQPWFRQKLFWIGSGIGLIAGYFIGRS